MRKTILKAAYCIHLVLSTPLLLFSSIGIFVGLPNVLFGNRTLLDSLIYIGLIPAALYGFAIYYIIEELAQKKQSGSKFFVYNFCIVVANGIVLFSTVNEMGY